MAHDIVVADEGDKGERDCWEARCSCGWQTGIRCPEAEADRHAILHRTQSFFADFANEIRRPSFGEMQANLIRSVLLRAEEANLYTPEKT